MNTPSTSLPAAPRLLLLGIGQAGTSLLAATVAGGLPEGALLAADTDALALARQTAAPALTMGAGCLRGLSAGGEPARGRAAAEETAEALREALAGRQLVVLLGGLGGGTATGALPVAARLAGEAGALVLAVVTLPFEFEGPRRQSQAASGLEELRRAADAVIALPNQRLAELTGQAPGLLEAFTTANTALAEGVRGVLGMLTGPALLPLDFATLAQALRGRHVRSALVSVTASGPQRVTELLDALQNSPLLGGVEALRRAPSVVASLRGGPDLTLPEVNRLAGALRAMGCDDRLVLGAGVDQGLNGRLVLTVLATEPAGAVANDPASPAATEDSETASAQTEAAAIETGFVQKPEPSKRRPSRVVPPAPELSPEARAALLARHAPAAARARRRSGPRMQQQQLALDIVSVSRFENSQPTIRDGHDLDVPTFIRRGVVLN
jgi:cell division protein FtsZ